MLKVVNLTKVYKVKGGVETRALDGVTLSFPETGMVFLLGKSGSGKSTLLNLIGGLDNPTSGEVIVKGRSSKDFTQDDFDSYRNTFIGFIFQEYNILNEFSVEDNIALALELQGKAKDKEAIDALLEQVDLQGYGKRKPNTLSGGQKQRIAIARALIKSPEIIMADEPTGALDSNTGKQVFETLKKLSKDKLVIVVSHDRDFAEQYGDRIIELKDGQVLSDVSKGLEEKQVVGGGNVTVVGGNTLCVEGGKTLTDEDFTFIRKFLTEREGAMITSGAQEIENVKKVNRITEDGKREVFLDTDEKQLPQKAYTKEDGKFIRSRLPLRRAAKIGVSGLKSKPIRLLFTIILCIVSFTMFGLFSTLMLYDQEATLSKSMQESNISYVYVQKQYLLRTHYNYGDEEDTWDRDETTQLTQAEIDEKKKSFGGVGFGGVEISNKNVSNLSSSGDVGELYQNAQLTYLSSLPEDSALRSNLVAGQYPAAEDEVLISEYLAQCIVKNGFSDNQEEITGVQDLIGKKLTINLGESQNNPNTEYKIAGVFDSNYQQLTTEFNLLTEVNSGGNRTEQSKQSKNFQAQYDEGLHGVLFVKDSLLQKVIATQKAQKAQQQSQNVFNRLMNTGLRFSFKDTTGNTHYAQKASALPANYNVYGKKTPETGEIVVTYNGLSQIAYNRTDEEMQGRSQLVTDMKDAVQRRFDEVLAQYNYTRPEWEIPDSTTEPEAYEIWEKYAGRRNYIQDQINEWGGWLRGEDIPQDPQSHQGYYIYHDIFLPVVTEGGADSYLTRFNNTFPLAEQKISIGGDLQPIYIWLDRLRNGGYNVWNNDIQQETVYTAEQKQAIATELLKFFENESFKGRNVVWQHQTGTDMRVGADRTFKVVGIIDADIYESMMFVDDETFAAMKETTDQYADGYGSTSWEETLYVESADACFDVAFFAYDHSNAQTEALKGFSYTYDDNHSRIVMQNAVALQVEMVNGFVTELADVFMWVGIVMAVFSALLLSNFISVSITNKKKDIGILRAVGARGVDVFKIFFSESSFIAILCVIISLIVSIVTCNVLNTELGEMLSGVSLFVFGPISVAILAGVAIGTAVVATFLPVYLAARKKPVESIRAL